MMTVVVPNGLFTAYNPDYLLSGVILQVHRCFQKIGKHLKWMVKILGKTLLTWMIWKQNHSIFWKHPHWSIALSLLCKSSPSTTDQCSKPLSTACDLGWVPGGGPSRKCPVVRILVLILCLVGGFQPTHLKNMYVKLDHLPQGGMNIQNDWNHHLGVVSWRKRGKLLSFSNFISPFLSHFWW